MGNKIPSYLLRNITDQYEPANISRVKVSFLDKTILNSARTMKAIYMQSVNATKENFFQRINPHVKLLSLIYMAVVISVVNNVSGQILASAFILLLFIVARLRVLQVYSKILFLALFFGFLVVLPASLNIITPGKIIYKLIVLNRPVHFLIYNIPQEIGFTANGIQVVTMVFLRVLNSVSFAMLVIFTTPFPSFIKSFKIIGVPDAFLMIISLAYKYIFILSGTIEETYFALKSRLAGNIKSKNIRKVISGRIFFIFKRSMIIYENTYFAMVSRGYTGKVRLNSKFHFSIMDIISLIIIVAAGTFIIIF